MRGVVGIGRHVIEGQLERRETWHEVEEGRVEARRGIRAVSGAGLREPRMRDRRTVSGRVTAITRGKGRREARKGVVQKERACGVEPPEASGPVGEVGGVERGRDHRGCLYRW